MRAFLPVLLAAGVVASPLLAAPEAPQRPAAAAEQAGPAASNGPSVRVVFVNTPLRQALQHLFRFRPADCLVAVDVPEVPVRAQMSYTHVGQAVDAVVNAARAADPELTLSAANGKYLIFHIRPFHPETALPGGAPAYSAMLQSSGHGEEELVTADFRDMPLRDVLRTAFTDSGLQYTVDPNVPNVPITINLRDIRLPALVRLVVRQASVSIPGLEVAKQDQIYVVSVRPGSPPAAALPGPPAGAGAERKITLDFEDIPLREAIALLFKGSGLQYTIDPNVPNVPITLNIRDISLPAALRLIIRQAATQVPGLTVSKEGDIYLVRRRLFPAAYVIPAALTLDDPAPEAFSYDFRGISLREAIAAVFRGTGTNYTVTADIPDVPITLNVREIRRPAALRLIVRQAAVRVPGITLAQEGGVYLVQRRAPAVTEEIPLQAEAPPDQQASDQDLTWEKVPIQFANAASLAMLFGGAIMPAPNGGPGADGELAGPPLLDPAKWESGGVGGLVPPGITGVLGCPRDNSLMVRGTPDDIQTLKNIIRLLDIPQRQFVLRLSIGGVTAEGRAGNNARLTLGSATHDRSFRFTAVPRLNGDGTIDISVEGTLTLHGTPHPLATHVSVASGESVTLFTLGEGLGATRIWLRASQAPAPINKGDDPS